MKKNIKKRVKKKEKKNLFISIIAIITIIMLIAGSTYAYWSWQTATNQQTNVRVTVQGATMTITGNNVTSTTLRPTNDCVNKSLVGEATVTVVNPTATAMRATPRLDVTLKPSHGNFDDTASNPDLGHLHWALVDTTNTTSKTCTNPDYQGTFFKVGKVTVSGGGTTDVSIAGPTITTMAENSATTINITNMDSSNEITDTLSFVAEANTTTTKNYKLYVWLDNTYEHINTGNSVTDPMQDLNINIKWSTKSTLIQE